MDQQTYARGRTAALIGFLMQLVLAIVVTLVAMYAQSPAIKVFAWYLFGGLPVWLILVMVYHQHALERIEALEAEQLGQRDASAAALFEEQGDDLALARRRLRSLQKWGVNGVGLAVAIYLLIAGVVISVQNYSHVTTRVEVVIPTTTSEDAPPREQIVYHPRTAAQAGETAVGEDANLTAVLFILAGVTILAFLVARYVAGMTRVRQWQLLRGGATYLMGNAVAGALLLVGTGLALFDSPLMLAYLAVVFPVLMAVIGAEILLHFLLNAYRPRKPGEQPRPAFDSRLLGWLAAPESLGRIISETINYQFGFEISRSWFYRLLSKAATPLTIFGLITLVLVSSIVIVGPHEQAIVTRFGQMVYYDEAADRIAMPSGLHFKMPWPIESVEKYAVGRVHEVYVGSGKTRTMPDTAILWTNVHTAGQEQYLVTAPSPSAEPADQDDAQDPPQDAAAAGAPGNSLVAAEVVVQFRVDDLGKFVETVTDPGDLERASEQRRRWAEAGRTQPAKGERVIDPCPMLTAIADRRVGMYFATHDLDTLLGTGRSKAGDELRAQVQADVDAAGLGVKIVFVGVTGIHPPQRDEVAKSFEEQIGALQEKQAKIENARRDASETLTMVAGSREQALELDAAINRLEQLQAQWETLKADPDATAQQREDLQGEMAEQNAQIDRLLLRSRGQAAVAILEAMAYRWQRPLGERGLAERFEAARVAHHNAPIYYPYKRYWDMLAEAMKPRPIGENGETWSPRIYVVPADAAPTINLELPDRELMVPTPAGR